MKKFFARQMAAVLVCVMTAALIPLGVGAAAGGVSAKPTMTFVYSNDTGATTTGNAQDPSRTVNGKEADYYQASTAMSSSTENLYLVYDLGEEAVSINRLRIKTKINSLNNQTFSLFYTDTAYAEGQNETDMNWQAILTEQAPYASMPEEFCFDTVSARQIKLVLNVTKARPIIYIVTASYSPLKTKYQVDAEERTITDIPKSEPIEKVKANISADNGYSYKICDASGAEKTLGFIAKTDKLIVTAGENNAAVEEYTFIPGSASTLLRGTALATQAPKGNTGSFSINLSDWFIYRIPKSYDLKKLESVLTMDYPGTITMPDELAGNKKITVTAENGKATQDYTIHSASGLAADYGTSADITPSENIGWWKWITNDKKNLVVDEANKDTFWIPDGINTMTELMKNIEVSQGASAELKTADGKRVSKYGELFSGMTLTVTAESGSASELTEAMESKTYTIKRDYARGKTVTPKEGTTFHATQGLPTRPVDGDKDFNSRFLMNQKTAGFVVDLGETKTFDSVSLMIWDEKENKTKIFAKSFEIEASNDNETFTKVGEKERETGDSWLKLNTDLDLDFGKPVTARYVRCTVNENDDETVTALNGTTANTSASVRASVCLLNFSVFDSGLRPSASLSFEQNGETVTNNLQNGEVTAEVSLIYGSMLTESADLILAVYKGDTLSRVVIHPMTGFTEDLQKIYSDAKITIAEDETRVDALLWDKSVGDLQPLCAKSSATKAE